MIKPYTRASALVFALALMVFAPVGEARGLWPPTPEELHHGSVVEVKPTVNTPAECDAPRFASPQNFPRVVEKIQIEYSTVEVALMSEGAVRLTYDVTPAGSAANIEILDAAGSPRFVGAAIAGVRAAKFEPAMAGKPIEYYGVPFELVFRIEGENRNGVHDWMREFDSESSARKHGDFAGSAAIIESVLVQPLNLYEMTTLSYDLAADYVGMHDDARALMAIRHATVDDGMDLIAAVRPSSLARRAELEARTHNYAAALCAFAKLKQSYPDFAPSAELEGLISATRADLAGTGPLRTEGELVESGRVLIEE